MTTNRAQGLTVRVESLLLALFGEHLLGRERVFSIASVIKVLAGLDVSEPATRATLARMRRRGLLTHRRSGRRVYVGLAPHGVAVLRDGQLRLESEVVNRDWDGQWTLLGFTVPENRRADRHSLRVRLRWAGFGLLQNGLWVAVSSVDVDDLIDGLDLTDHVVVFRGEVVAPLDPTRLVSQAWNLATLAAGYTRFIDRWDDAELRSGDDPLVRQTQLCAEWLLLIRDDPRLPQSLLPTDWPGLRAQRLFHTLHDEYAEPARLLADELLTPSATTR